jgi:hypothetical protein
VLHSVPDARHLKPQVDAIVLPLAEDGTPVLILDLQARPLITPEASIRLKPVLKRNGEPISYSVPGFSGKLTRAELDAYNEAFDVIKSEFAGVQHVRDILNDLKKDPILHMIPGNCDGEVVETRDDQMGHIQWTAR